MKKVCLGLFIMCFAVTAMAQNDDNISGKGMMNKSGDHFMIQIAHNIWSGVPDSIKDNLGGFNRSANAYFMLNKPFKTNEKFAIAFGLGVSTANMYMDNMTVGIDSSSALLSFKDASNAQRYKKYKVATTLLEVPLELRFTAKPLTPNKSLKGALGVKVGQLISASTKGKTLIDAAGVERNNAIYKVKAKNYFQSTRISATARFGYGLFSIFGTYSLTPLLKDGVGPDIKPIQIGLTISGL